MAPFLWLPHRYRIEWSRFSSGTPLIEALNAGAIDIGLVDDGSLIVARSANVPVRAIATIRAVVTGARLRGTGVTHPNHRGSQGSRHRRPARLRPACWWSQRVPTPPPSNVISAARRACSGPAPNIWPTRSGKNSIATVALDDLSLDASPDVLIEALTNFVLLQERALHDDQEMAKRSLFLSREQGLPLHPFST